MKIAIVRLSALGDIIHTMVVVQFIKKNFPDIQIDWFVDSYFSEVVNNCPLIDRTFSINLKNLNLLNLIKNLKDFYTYVSKQDKYDLIIDFQGLLKSGIVTSMIPAKKKYGFDYRSSRESLSSLFYSHTLRIPYAENIIIRNLKLASEAFGINIKTSDIDRKKPFFQVKKTTNHKEKYILIVIGASFKSKEYSYTNYAEIAKSIDMKFIVIWGNSRERLIAKKLARTCNNVELADKLSFSQLVDIVNQATLVLGGDTGPTHLAWAQNIPSITLFGSTSSDRNFYSTKENVSISSETLNISKKIDRNHSLINNISPSRVTELIRKII